MAAGRIVIPGWMPALDSNGAPIPNAQIYIYLNGTTTLATVYSDDTLTTPIANPVEANSSGQFPEIWADDANLFSISVDAPFGPPGIPFTFDSIGPATVSAVIEVATEAAEAVVASKAETTGSNLVVTTFLGALGQFATRTAAIAASPVGLTQLVTYGYAAVGDGGGATYVKRVSEPSHPGKIQTADGAWWELSVVESVDIRQFGGKADSSSVGSGTNSSPALTNAILAAAALKKSVFAPEGGFRLSETVTYDKSAVSGDNGFVVNIRGEGPGQTRFYCSAGGIVVQGAATPGIYGSFLTVEGLYLQGPGTTNYGIEVNLCGFVSVKNVRATGFSEGLRMRGVISSTVDRCFLNNNAKNFVALPDAGGIYPPNAITINESWIADATLWGVEVTEPASFSIIGGSVEGNGTDTGVSVNNRGGVHLINPGTGGHGAHSSNGVYYENNHGLADIFIDGSSRTFSISLTGNNFGRLSSTPPAAGPPVYSVFALNATHAGTITLSGNGFGELAGGFVPTSGEPYVRAAGSVYTVVDLGNSYMTAAARPDYASNRAIQNNSVAYAIGYITSAGAVEGRSTNIASVTKLATGKYKLNFGQPITGRKWAVCSFGVLALGLTSTFDNSSITIDTVNTAGTAIDAEFGVEVYTTVPW